MTGQLAFDLPQTPARNRDGFFVSPANAAALSAVDGWRAWPMGRMVLAGPPGSGKTHLALIWAEAASARIIPAPDLITADVASLAESAVAVDDADAAIGDARAEAALFHLWNLTIAAGVPLLMTAAAPPRDWGIRLPDLASRVQSAALTRIGAPDDALLSAVLVKLFADRQVAVDPTLVAYLTSRMPRSLAAVREIVDVLDSLSLRRGSAISRLLAAEVLDMLTPDAD